MEFDLMKIWSHMTLPNQGIIILLFLMSIFSLYVIVERFLTYQAASAQNLAYVQALSQYLSQHQIDEAIRAAKVAFKSPVARVMEAGLGALKQGRDALHKDGPNDVGSFDIVDSVNRALERVRERETSNLRKGMTYLGTVATSTPFIGLLGTVIGILSAFQAMGTSPELETVGPAISEALIATAVGLGIAIVAAIAFNYYTSRIEQFVVDMNDISSEFVDYVLREGRA
jgi:biopolymer transport protein ExbB